MLFRVLTLRSARIVTVAALLLVAGCDAQPTSSPRPEQSSISPPDGSSPTAEPTPEPSANSWLPPDGGWGTPSRYVHAGCGLLPVVERSDVGTKLGNSTDPAVTRLLALAGLFGAAASDPSLARTRKTAEALYGAMSDSKSLDTALLSARVVCRGAQEARPSDDDVLRFVCHTSLELSDGNFKVDSARMDFLRPDWWKTAVILGLGPLAADTTGVDALGWNASEISLANHDDDQRRYDDAVTGMLDACARVLQAA